MSFEANLTTLNSNFCKTEDANYTNNKNNVVNQNATSIFTEDNKEEETLKSTNAEELEKEFNEVEEKQGVIGKIWNGIKNVTGLGLSSNEVENKIEDYKDYNSRQESAVDMVSNAAAGMVVAGSVIGALGTGGASLLVGAATGGTIKAAIKTAERSTNEIKGDEFDGKEILKDAIVGAADGAITVGTARVGSFVRNIGKETAKTGLKTSVAKGLIKGAAEGSMKGFVAGGASGAVNYVVDTAFDKDKDFNFEEFVDYTKTNAKGGAIVGSIFGGINGAAKGYTNFKYDSSAPDISSTKEGKFSKLKNNFSRTRRGIKTLFTGSKSDKKGLFGRALDKFAVNKANESPFYYSYWGDGENLSQ